MNKFLAEREDNMFRFGNVTGRSSLPGRYWEADAKKCSHEK